MRSFVYYNNSTANNGEPDKAMDYYNYLKGIWKDNRKMTYGGNGYNEGTNTDINADFMFPGNSDIWGWGTRTKGNEAYGKLMFGQKKVQETQQTIDVSCNQQVHLHWNQVL